MSPTDRCGICHKLTGWNLLAQDREGNLTIPLCRSHCYCTKCGTTFPASELQEVRKFESTGEKNHDLHLECEGCRNGA